MKEYVRISKPKKAQKQDWDGAFTTMLNYPLPHNIPTLV